MVLWYSGGNTWGTFIGFAKGYHDAQLPLGVSRFGLPLSYGFMFGFSLYCAFAGFWRTISNNPWQRWSVWGSAFILFNIWFSVQVSVAVNAWYGPFIISFKVCWITVVVILINFIWEQLHFF